MQKSTFSALVMVVVMAITGCNQNTPANNHTEQPAQPAQVVRPAFSADSAYAYIQKQLDFGPRNMNSKGHDACADWMIAQLKQWADTVYVQKFTATGFDGQALKSTNIIASFNPTAAKRVLLCSHWDSRPWADQDTKDRDKPILAANDGASGVGVLIELARIIRSQPVDVGVDLFLIDAEDYGYSSSLSDLVAAPKITENTYCLGSQHWGKNPHVPGYKAEFGILLDMVGARNSIFTREGHSSNNASWVQQMVWGNAAALGHGSLFTNLQTAAITDDHFYINELTGIPTIDIIHFDASTPTGFGPYWHTHNDNMDVIDKNTLQAVGDVLVYTLYKYNMELK